MPATIRSTRTDGLIPIADAARLCGVTERAVRQWTTRGYLLRDGTARTRLPVAAREGHLILVDAVDLAKAEYHTAVRARRAPATA